MSDISESEGYSPQMDHSEDVAKDQVYRRRAEKQGTNSIEGKWTEDESLKYILFMDHHYKIFVSKEKRKSQRIFKTLADFLSSRTPRQCRSHFQKIMNKFKKLKKVLQFYQQQIGHAQYQQMLLQLGQKLKPQINIKQQESERTFCVTHCDVGVQTDKLQVGLGDLTNIELMKLMNLLNDYHKIQLPVPMWMPHTNRQEARVTIIEQTRCL